MYEQYDLKTWSSEIQNYCVEEEIPIPRWPDVQDILADHYSASPPNPPTLGGTPSYSPQDWGAGGAALRSGQTSRNAPTKKNWTPSWPGSCEA